MSEQASRLGAKDQSSHLGVKRVLKRSDLIIYGLVILTPTAPYPVYGIIQKVSGGHAALAYIVAMVAMLFTAGSYAKMATAFPSAGSTYTYVQRTFTPYIGFLAGWAMILDYFLIPLESVIYSALTANRLLPSVSYSVWVVVFTLAITFINVRGTRVMANANTAMMIVMSSCALLFIWLAGSYVAYHQGLAFLMPATSLPAPASMAVQPIVMGAAIATLSYIGFDAVSTLAEDSINPERDIGFTTVLVCILQTIICVLTVYVASRAWPDFRTFPQTETAILDISQRIGGTLMFGFVTLVLLVAGIASALTGQAGASRLLFAMGRDRVISHSVFAYLHPRFRTPVRAIFAISIVSLAGALLLHFEIAVELLNFGAFAGFVLVNLSVIQHYFLRLKLRTGSAFFYNLVSPLLGAICCGYVWMNLSTKAKIVGFIWLAVGSIYLAILTRGFRTNPKELRFEA